MVQVGRIEINPSEFGHEPDVNDVPILATRNLVLFPGVTIPIALTRESSLKIANEASEHHFPVGIVCQIDPDEDKPNVSRSLYRYGVFADVYQVIELPDGSHTALIHGRERFRILGKGAGQYVKGELSARVKVFEDSANENDPKLIAVTDKIFSMANDLSSEISNDNSFASFLNGIPDIAGKMNFIATNYPFPADSKANLLSISDMNKRAIEMLTMIMAETERVAINHEVMAKASERMKDNQRSAFLQMQMEAIREELYGDGSDGDDIEELEERAQKAGMPEKVYAVFEKELGKLKRLNTSTPDYSVQWTYLDTLVDLPWGNEPELNPNISEIRNILNQDHFGLEKVKQRIIEQVAVMVHSGSTKASILCLVGPPGVGKTSIGKSIARATGRAYARVALGGIHDEAEIRGHRRTYIGAMPGRIIKALKTAGTKNPLLLLDEIDKVNQDYKGDPSSALLEVLDPEQNSTFHDNYIDIDYDLSKVMFIATANNISTIPAPLLDRMEVIELSGYLPEEKLEIAHRHLIPKILKDLDINDEDKKAGFTFDLSDETLTAIIENYTAESGVRQLEKQIASLARKAVLAHMEGSDRCSDIKPADLKELVGLPKYNKDKYEGNEFPGVVTGLAWTSVGGEILLAEASLAPGKGDKLSITGNLGDVMKESATIALQWVKAHATEIGIDPSKFESNNLHIHFPEGAIPKDGPSAGITIATAIASIFTGRKVAERIAMTGEVTLRGKVLPVGGIKEKILAAKRAGIDTIILSSENRRDIEDIPESYRAGMTFKYVDTVSQVLDYALLKA